MQQVKYGGALSDSRSLPSGVPEGSVLGPTMFSVFINSLFSYTPDANIVAYDDDITPHVRSNTHLECIALMQCSMDAVDAWSASHGLSINYANVLPCSSRHALRNRLIQMLNYVSAPLPFVLFAT